MSLPEFGSFSLQDDNYITTNIVYRTWPSRSIATAKTTRKPGTKLTSEEFGERRITMEGFVVGSSSSDLQTKIDDLYESISTASQLLEIESGRQYTATVTSIAVDDPHYAQDMVPFELEFLCADPFAYKSSSETVSVSVTSGVGSEDYTVTISGSIFAEPSIVYSTTSGAGITGNPTTTSGVKIELGDTGENVTWSGGGTPLDYGNSLTFNYETYKILKDTTEQNFSGVFSRWEPDSQTFTVTYSGTNQGGTIDLTYTPRYL